VTPIRVKKGNKMSRIARHLAVALFSAGCLTPLATRAQTSPDAATKIAIAVLPLPKEMRNSATVVDVVGGGKVDTLRKGTSDMVCAYHPPTVSQRSKTGEKVLVLGCYHEAISALARRASAIQRELTAAGKPADNKAVEAQVDAEIKSGKLKLAPGPTIGFRMAGPVDAFNPAADTVSPAVHSWQMVIIPYATGTSLSLPEKESGGMPWVMAAGTYMAHIMIDPQPMGSMQ
jgi:hypothetical protein